MRFELFRGAQKKRIEKLIKNRIRIVDIYFFMFWEKWNAQTKTPFVDLKMFSSWASK